MKMDVTRDCTLLIVEHDMQVVFSLADRISVLVYGEILATGTPAEIRGDAARARPISGGSRMSQHATHSAASKGTTTRAARRTTR